MIRAARKRRNPARSSPSRPRSLAQALGRRLFMREHGGKILMGVLRPGAGRPRRLDHRPYRLRHDVVRRRRRCRVRYAREGFAVFEYMATMIKRYEDGYRSWPSNAAISCPAASCPRSAIASCRAISPAHPSRASLGVGWGTGTGGGSIPVGGRWVVRAAAWVPGSSRRPATATDLGPLALRGEAGAPGRGPAGGQPPGTHRATGAHKR